MLNCARTTDWSQLTLKLESVTVLILVTIVTVCPIVSGQSSLSEISFYVNMHKKKLGVTIYYENTNDAWAHHVADLILMALPRVEELAGFDYPFNYNITVRIQQGDNNYNMLQQGVYLIPRTWDFAVIHELVHYWTGIYQERWLSEGYATLLPLVVFQERGLLSQIAQVRDTHVGWFNAYFSKYEQPLDTWVTDTTPELHNFLYGKTYCLFYILSRELGVETLTAASHTIFESHRKATSVGFKDVLEKLTGKQLDDLFSGWIFGKIYKKYAPTDFGDQDNDGLLTIDEKFAGTDPLKWDTDGDGIGDGADPHPLDSLPENATRLMAAAEDAIHTAEREGRMLGLELARQKLADASAAYNSGNYREAVDNATEALQLAANAVAESARTATEITQNPVSGQTDWSDLSSLTILLAATGLVLLVILLRRKRSTSS